MESLYQAPRDPWATHTDPDRWTSIRCPGEHLPAGRRAEPGEMFGIRYGAWRAVETRFTPAVDYTPDDHALLQRYKPGFRDRYRPYTVVVDHVTGPNLISSRSRVHLAGLSVDWVLLGERYPMCACHRHPWPCQDADRDRVAAMQAKAMGEELAKSLPGVCPACGEPITGRQQTVSYPGPNLIVPGGPEPQFHLRGGCRGAAKAYELRWIAEDPRRERIITFPKCPGTLIVHSRKVTECAGGFPECEGHFTHDHAASASCPGIHNRPCPRGCTSAEHRGCGFLPRRPRRQPTQATR